VADFAGGPEYGSADWPFASAPAPSALGLIDTLSGRLALVLGEADTPSPAPLIEWLDPSPGTPIARDAAITVRVTDANLELAILSARFTSIGLEEVVWRDGEFAARYGSSELAVAGAARTFVIRRTGGWPASVRIAVDAVDADGQVGSE